MSELKTADEIWKEESRKGILSEPMVSPYQININAMQAYAMQVAEAVKIEAASWVVPGCPIPRIKADILDINLTQFIK